MESISQKVSTILNTYYNQEGSIICDNGQGNVIMIDGSPLQFDFVDTQETDSRTEIEDDKVKFLNDVMDLFFDIQRYVTICQQIDYSYETHGCETYPCAPGCKCGNWGYQDETMTCMTNLDKQMLIESVGDEKQESVLENFESMKLD
jgi:hypothetical protein